MLASLGSAHQQVPARLSAADFIAGIEKCAAHAQSCCPDDPTVRSQLFCAMLAGWIAVSDKALSARIQAMYIEPNRVAA